MKTIEENELEALAQKELDRRLALFRASKYVQNYITDFIAGYKAGYRKAMES